MTLKADPILVRISAIDPGGPAEKAGIRVDDGLVAINGSRPRDIIDYQLARETDIIHFRLMRGDRILDINIDNTRRVPLGLYFEKSIFDQQKLCENNCVFCFIDQMPSGLRDSLYVKDDDFRLSFLYGNFITLTNLSRADLKRIVEQRLSPLYVSIHSTSLEIRRRLMNHPQADRALDHLRVLLDGGIQVHLQIVLCPDINDGPVLDETLHVLLRDFEGAESVGIVPVGLTGSRSGLPRLEAFSSDQAMNLVAAVHDWQKRAFKKKDYRWVYAADEFYLLAGIDLPPLKDYDDFPQLENGVGIARTFIEEVKDWPVGPEGAGGASKHVHILTAPMGSRVIESVVDEIAKKAGLGISLIKAQNDWLGGRVSVSGLLSGSDIIKAIIKSEPQGIVLIPDICLNSDGLFLDDLSVADVIKETGYAVRAVPTGGSAFMLALAELIGG